MAIWSAMPTSLLGAGLGAGSGSCFFGSILLGAGSMSALRNSSHWNLVDHRERHRRRRSRSRSRHRRHHKRSRSRGERRRRSRSGSRDIKKERPERESRDSEDFAINSIPA